MNSPFRISSRNPKFYVNESVDGSSRACDRLAAWDAFKEMTKSRDYHSVDDGGGDTRQIAQIHLNS